MMTDILLEELNKNDLRWLSQTGAKKELNTGSILIEENSPVDHLYIIIDGELSASIKRNLDSRLASVFAALEGDAELEQNIANYYSGEIIGEMNVLDARPSSTTIRATKNSMLLAIPHQALKDKINEDLGFASRFYRAIAILILQRFQNLIQIYLKRKMGRFAPLQDAPVIFGELSDSDVDWMLQKGSVQQIPGDTVFLRSGEQVENFYVLLKGTVSVSVSEPKQNPLTSVFAALESDESEPREYLGREIGIVSRGEIMGELAALDLHRSYSSLKTLQDSSVLVIPRKQLLIKLQQDIAMASRFYRIIVYLLSGRLTGLVSRLGFGKSSYQMGQGLSQDMEYEDEIDLDLMDNLTLGGARFDWMLRRLRV